MLIQLTYEKSFVYLIKERQQTKHVHITPLSNFERLNNKMKY